MAPELSDSRQKSGLIDRRLTDLAGRCIEADRWLERCAVSRWDDGAGTRETGRDSMAAAEHPDHDDALVRHFASAPTPSLTRQ